MSAKALSTTPYFLRALYEWSVDGGLTPYITVRVDETTRVPMAYVKDGQIVLNIGPGAVRSLVMDNEAVSFSARFGGVAHEIYVPVANVLAIYARETGEGMAFPQQESAAPDADAGPERPKGRPSLRVVK